MKIGALELPKALSQAIEHRTLSREIGSWPLLYEKDHFGNHLETELGYVFESIDQIVTETEKLREYFPTDTDTDTDDFIDAHVDLHGCAATAIPYIRDFSEVVCFAFSGDGAQFCLDYRGNITSPSVIWWDDVYWRIIAPDFDTFLALFDLNRNEK
jgi:hypothetical protein